MTTPDPVPFACQAAAIDGGCALEAHQQTCTVCRPPEDDALFEIDAPKTQERGPLL